jgi:hypothetical protein
MAHIPFNHLNPKAFNDFVPEATRIANNKFIKNILVVGGIALGIWIGYEIIDYLHKKNKLTSE